MKRKNTINPSKPAKTTLFNGRVERYLVACSAVAAGAATLTTPNQAAANIVYSGIQNINILPTGGGLYLDFNPPFSTGTTAAAVPAWDINPYGGNYRFWLGANPGNVHFEISNPGTSIGTVDILNPGDVVDGSITNWNGANGESTIRVQTFNAPGTTMYAGFEFTPTNGSGNHYGWIQFLRGDNVSQDGTIIDFAWNDVAGAPISVGQTSAVPEPSSLALLAAGLAGLTLWRRRRQLAQM